ncbi:MAG: glucose dehydrogenase [Dehalococcoidia bacterium]|nr:MAG: glucose dehydrogenase [Dehalococcoidia bacterium]
MRLRPAIGLLALSVALVLAGCGSGDEKPQADTSTGAGATSGASPSTSDAPPKTEGTATAAAASSTPGPASTASSTPAPIATPRANPPRTVRAVDALGGRRFDKPTELGEYPGGYFVAEQVGTILRVTDNGTTDTILDIRDRVLSTGNEEGLLSVALDPRFEVNRWVWTYYSMTSPRRSVLVRYTAGANGVIDKSSALLVLEQAQPFANHNGGAIRFGPDGLLYLGLGDGGSGGDPQGNGQNLGTLLGKIIRLDVRNSSIGEPYRIPADNPFVDRAGAKGEVWAYGLRNPWRMSFDRATGALWVADVGQGEVEEIDVVRRGDNLGWRVMEGDRCYGASTCNRTGLVLPVTQYTHTGGRCSVTGGPAYRGVAVPEVSSTYLYADYCSGELWSLPLDGGEPVIVAKGLGNVTSMATDAAGRIYILRQGKPIATLASP